MAETFENLLKNSFQNCLFRNKMHQCCAPSTADLVNIQRGNPYSAENFTIPWNLKILSMT